MPGTVLGPGDTAVSTADPGVLLLSLNSLASASSPLHWLKARGSSPSLGAPWGKGWYSICHLALCWAQGRCQGDVYGMTKCENRAVSDSLLRSPLAASTGPGPVAPRLMNTGGNEQLTDTMSPPDPLSLTHTEDNKIRPKSNWQMGRKLVPTPEHPCKGEILSFISWKMGASQVTKSDAF